MAKVLLISIDTLKKEYLVDDNLDDKYIISNIQKGMDFVVEPIFEETAWSELLLQVENNTVSDKNKLLINKYIKPILAYFVMSEIVYSTAYKLKNAGLEGSQNGEQPNANRYKELVEISNKYKQDSDTYVLKFREYISETGVMIPDDVYVPRNSFYLGSNSKYQKYDDFYDCTYLNSCMCISCYNKNKNNII